MRASPVRKKGEVTHQPWRDGTWEHGTPVAATQRDFKHSHSSPRPSPPPSPGRKKYPITTPPNPFLWVPLIVVSGIAC